MDRNEAKRHCRRLRADVLQLIWNSQYGFLGSCFSCIELVVAATKFANANWRCPLTKLVLSKGHAAPVIYAGIRQETGMQPLVRGYATHNTGLEGHPNARLSVDVDVSTGSLGIGIAVAVGRAMAATVDKYLNPVVVVAGDAEFQEGVTWEALHIAGRQNLTNLIVIADCNGMQSTGCVPETISLHDLGRAAGWEVIVLNGHDVTEIVDCIDCHIRHRPLLILAKTKRGHGFEGYPCNARMSWMPTTELYETNLSRLRGKFDD